MYECIFLTIDAFTGYDLDGDGIISRQELLKMFKAYFHLSMELVRDVVKTMEEGMMESFDDEASKPISASFSAPIPLSNRDFDDESRGRSKLKGVEEEGSGMLMHSSTRPPRPITPTVRSTSIASPTIRSTNFRRGSYTDRSPSPVSYEDITTSSLRSARVGSVSGSPTITRPRFGSISETPDGEFPIVRSCFNL
jgi:hypothetical protein